MLLSLPLAENYKGFTPCSDNLKFSNCIHKEGLAVFFNRLLCSKRARQRARLTGVSGALHVGRAPLDARRSIRNNRVRREESRAA